MTDKAPVIKPIKIKEFEFKQSKYKQCGSLPVRSILLGPSGSGKGVLLQNMILDIYKNVLSEFIYFHRVLMLITHGYLLRNTYPIQLIKKTMSLIFIMIVTTPRV